MENNFIGIECSDSPGYSAKYGGTYSLMSTDIKNSRFSCTACWYRWKLKPHGKKGLEILLEKLQKFDLKTAPI